MVIHHNASDNFSMEKRELQRYIRVTETNVMITEMNRFQKQFIYL